MNYTSVPRMKLNLWTLQYWHCLGFSFGLRT